MKQFLSKIASFVQIFKNKHHLTFNNSEQDEPLWQLNISPLKIVFGFIFIIILIVVTLILLIIYTPILDKAPGYIGLNSRQLLIENIIKLDSLQKEVELWDNYRNSISDIVNGNVTSIRSIQAPDDSTLLTSNLPISASQEELSLRERVESYDSQRRRLSSFTMYTPVEGVITKHYSVQDNGRGVEITTSGEEPVLAVADGTIILTEWTLNNGFVVQIHHGDNMVSTYKKLSKLFKKPGDMVKGGEVFGNIGDSEKSSNTPPTLDLEIWINGHSVDPQNYLVF